MSSFVAEAHYNPYLKPNASDMTAVIVVRRGDGTGLSADPSEPCANVVLRVWTPEGTRVEQFREVYPDDKEDLAEHRSRVDDLIEEFPTREWRADERKYCFRVAFDPQPTGQKRRVGKVQVIADGDLAADVAVYAEWVDDAQADRVDPLVAELGCDTGGDDPISEQTERTQSSDRSQPASGFVSEDAHTARVRPQP
jgi:hypothetical protein